MSKSAKDKMLKFLGVRDHAENELREKLLKSFDSAEVEAAIEYARRHRLIKTPAELAEQVYFDLSQKNKGHIYITNYLEMKGLPTHAIDHERELEKARTLIHLKLKITGNPTENEKIKIYRLLSNRGFDEQTIRTLAHEES